MAYRISKWQAAASALAITAAVFGADSAMAREPGSRAFKREVGLSPAPWREQQRAN